MTCAWHPITETAASPIHNARRLVVGVRRSGCVEPIALPPCFVSEGQLLGQWTTLDPIRDELLEPDRRCAARGHEGPKALATIRPIAACAAFSDSMADRLSLMYDAMRMGGRPGGTAIATSFVAPSSPV